MLETFYPDREIGSVYSFDFQKAYEEGIRGVIFDIDNTLVPHGEPADQRAISLFQNLHALGMATMLLSNNKEPRVKSFAEQVNSPYMYKANKPSVRGYVTAMERMNTDTKTTLFIGDQLFTDVWGAKRAGIPSYLTTPIHPKEEIQIVLKRKLEKIVLNSYHKKFNRIEK